MIPTTPPVILTPLFQTILDSQAQTKLGKESLAIKTSPLRQATTTVDNTSLATKTEIAAENVHLAPPDPLPVGTPLAVLLPRTDQAPGYQLPSPNPIVTIPEDTNLPITQIQNKMNLLLPSSKV